MPDLRTTEELYGDEVIADGLKSQADELMEKAREKYRWGLYNLGGAAVAFSNWYGSEKGGENWPTEKYEMLVAAGTLGFVALGHFAEALGPHFSAWRKNRIANRLAVL